MPYEYQWYVEHYEGPDEHYMKVQSLRKVDRVHEIGGRRDQDHEMCIQGQSVPELTAAGRP